MWCHYWSPDNDSNDIDQIVDQADHGHNDPWRNQTGFCLAKILKSTKKIVFFGSYLPSTMDEHG